MSHIILLVVKIKFSCCTLTKEELKNLSHPKFPDQEAIEIFKALSHPLRLEIIRVLLIDNEVCTCEFQNLFEIESQPAVTKQLSKMRKQGILTSRKITFKKKENTRKFEKIETNSGKWTYYRIAENKKAVIEHLMKPLMNEVMVKEKAISNSDVVLVLK